MGGVATGAGEVAGMTWYELGFERLDGRDELAGLLEAVCELAFLVLHLWGTFSLELLGWVVQVVHSLGSDHWVLWLWLGTDGWVVCWGAILDLGTQKKLWRRKAGWKTALITMWSR